MSFSPPLWMPHRNQLGRMVQWISVQSCGHLDSGLVTLKGLLGTGDFLIWSHSRVSPSVLPTTFFQFYFIFQSGSSVEIQVSMPHKELWTLTDSVYDNCENPISLSWRFHVTNPSSFLSASLVPAEQSQDFLFAACFSPVK